MRQETLRPVDVVVALRLALQPGELYESLASTLGISVSTAHQAVQRLTSAGLVRQDRTVNRSGLLEFLRSGVRYAFYAEPGPEVRGVATAHAAPPLRDEIVSDDAFVWPSADGTMRGASISPLYDGAAELPKKAPELYEALVLVDAIRVGKARERSRAAELLEEVLESPAS